MFHEIHPMLCPSRYQLTAPNNDVTAAWTALAGSAYTLDLWGQDTGGVGHMPGTNYNNFAWENVDIPTPCSSLLTHFSSALALAFHVFLSLAPALSGSRRLSPALNLETTFNRKLVLPSAFHSVALTSHTPPT
jgi:hypothetical protein